MRMLQGIASLVLLMSTISGCATLDGIDSFDASRVILLQREPLRSGEDIAVVDTECGTFSMRFFPSEAPLAVENFLTLATDGYYNGLPVLPGGEGENPPGAVLASGAERGSSGRGISVVNGARPFSEELSENLWHFSGAVSSLGTKEGNDSQFFIIGTTPLAETSLKEITSACYPPTVIEAFRTAGGRPEFTFEHTIFAQIFEGLPVVDRVIARSLEGEAVTIQKITLTKYEPEKQKF